VKWLLRFIGWATLLAIPCFLLSDPWQRALAALAENIVNAFGAKIEMQEVQIMAPFDLGIYVAMCLASRNAPPLARRMALERGSLLVLALELLTVIAAVLLYFAFPAGSSRETGGLRLTEYVIEFIPWASATVVWLIMLGAWELPLGGAPANLSRSDRAKSN